MLRSLARLPALHRERLEEAMPSLGTHPRLTSESNLGQNDLNESNDVTGWWNGSQTILPESS